MAILVPFLPTIWAGAAWAPADIRFCGKTRTDPRPIAEDTVFKVVLTPLGKSKPAATVFLGEDDGLTFVAEVFSQRLTAEATTPLPPGQYRYELFYATDDDNPLPIFQTTVTVARTGELAAELGGATPLPPGGGAQGWALLTDGQPVILLDNTVAGAAAAVGYANEQGDWAKEQGDYAKEMGDDASTALGLANEIVDDQEALVANAQALGEQVEATRDETALLKAQTDEASDNAAVSAADAAEALAQILFVSTNGTQHFQTYTAMTAAFAGLADRVAMEVATGTAGEVGTYLKVPGNPAPVKTPTDSLSTVAAKVTSLTPRVPNYIQDLVGERWRIGNALYATLTPDYGFYARKMTLPAVAVMDDDFATPVKSRIFSDGTLPSLFKRLPVEFGFLERWRAGSNLLMTLDVARGLYPRRMMLPATAVMDDLPDVPIYKRFGAVAPAYIDGASYAAYGSTDTITGNRVVNTVRKADGHQFRALTSSAINATPLAITADAKVVYYDDVLARFMWVGAEGGSKYRAFADVASIDAWGDSLTAGTGAVGSGAGQGAYPKQLADRITAAGITVTVVNNGVGAQTSPQIVARQGGAPALLTVTSNLIPASGAVAVTSWSATPITSLGPGPITGTLAGVPGTLTATVVSGVVTAMSFTRTTAGSSTACPPATAFIPDLGVQTQERLNLLKMGRNDGSTGGATTLSAIASAYAYLKSIHRKALVLGVEYMSIEIGKTAQTNFEATNATLASTYGDDYVNLTAVPTNDEMTAIGFVADSYGVYGNFRTDAADMTGRASGGWSFSGNPTPGDTVSIGGTVITFGTTVTIGASALATAANLATYINANSGSLGVTAVSGTTAGGTVICTVVAVTAGSAANSVALAKAGSVLTLSGATLANGSAVGGVPSGMMSGATTTTDDWLHRNNLGYALCALRVYRKLVAKNWIAGLPVA